ncbi:hypothetical protein BDY24DRAFT_142309 [Mrakia frigida]|uniref:uncharacterized protein n=1 Tax=Mrakia frigida TaxID=29902 RepID=UPI003FCBFDCA
MEISEGEGQCFDLRILSGNLLQGKQEDAWIRRCRSTEEEERGCRRGGRRRRRRTRRGRERSARILRSTLRTRTRRSGSRRRERRLPLGTRSPRLASNESEAHHGRLRRSRSSPDSCSTSLQIFRWRGFTRPSSDDTPKGRSKELDNSIISIDRGTTPLYVVSGGKRRRSVASKVERFRNRTRTPTSTGFSPLPALRLRQSKPIIDKHSHLPLSFPPFKYLFETPRSSNLLNPLPSRRPARITNISISILILPPPSNLVLPLNPLDLQLPSNRTRSEWSASLAPPSLPTPPSASSAERPKPPGGTPFEVSSAGGKSKGRRSFRELVREPGAATAATRSI